MTNQSVDARLPRWVTAGAVAFVFAGTVLAGPLPQQDVEATAPTEEPAPSADASVTVEDTAAVELLRAVVMDVQGRAQWRRGPEAAWSAAEVDDVLEPGAMIRTGRNSLLTLRVVPNATIMVDRNTRMQLPEMIRDGETLRTAVQLTRGRADFKVDRVGLTNDFSVVTPSTTLAVRGTDWGIEYGGFEGTKVFSARTNAMAAIELRYLLTQRRYALSGGTSSSDAHPNPVISQLFQSLGPPRVQTAQVEGTDATPELLVDSFARNLVGGARQVDLNAAGARRTLANPIFIPPPVPPSVPEPPAPPVDVPGDQQLVEP